MQLSPSPYCSPPNFSFVIFPKSFIHLHSFVFPDFQLNLPVQHLSFPSSLSFFLHALLSFSPLMPLFPPQLLSNKQSRRNPEWTALLELLFSNTLLIWLRTGRGPWPSLSAAVYGIRYAWNTFDLMEGFSHVFATVTMVCGFKQILWVCLNVCIRYTVCVCYQRMHDWPEILSCNWQWNVELRDGEEREMRNRDERIEGITTVDSKVWDSGVDYLQCCGACCIKINQFYLLNDDIYPWYIKETYWQLAQDWLSLLDLSWFVV